MKLSLLSKKLEVSGVWSFIFMTPRDFSWLPGQYMHYVLAHPDQDDRGSERWFTISSAPFEKNIMLTTRFDGERESSFKKALLNLNESGQIESDGPKGEFVLINGDVHHILIAGGIGITPFRSMLAQSQHDHKVPKATLMYANRDESFVFGKELDDIAGVNPQFKIQKYVGDQRITDEELKTLIAQPDTVFYVSGPKPMVENYYNKLLELGAPEERVKKDFFPGY